MNKSQSIKEIATAMAKAQAKILNAEKAAENPAFKRGAKVSTYADLTAIWDACREQLTGNGIAVIQSPSTDGAVVSVTTLLVHSSGEWIESDPMRAAAQGPDAQKIGSATTYLRRYSLAAMVGVAPENEDDDGNKASGVEASAGRGKVGVRPKDAKPAPLDPVVRKAEALAWIEEKYPGKVRDRLAFILNRTFPVAEEIKLHNLAELEKVEQWIVLGNAAMAKDPAVVFGAE